MAVVYFHRRKDTNQVFYVGIGKSKKRAYWTYTRSDWWYKVVNKVGYDIEIVHKGLTWDEACEKEKYYIKEFGRRDKGLGPLVNQTDGGDGQLGFIHSEETRKKFRENNLGPKNPNWGKPKSDETKRKISEGNKGRTLTKKHRQKLKDNHVGFSGKNHTEQYKKRMSKVHKQIDTDKEGLKKRNKRCPQRKLTQQNVLEAIDLYKSGKFSYYQLAEKYGVSKPTIMRAIKGQSWKYLHIS